MWKCSVCNFQNQDLQRVCRKCQTSKYAIYGTTGEDYLLSSMANTGAEKSSFDESGVNNEIRIVLIGKTGSGKSATGNSLLGYKQFESKISGSSITSKCQRGEQRRNSKKVSVVDTPGLFDTGMTAEMVTMEIVKCIGMTAPGPHAMVLVVNIGRFTQEEQDTLNHFVAHFGDKMLTYTIVLFTRKDELSKSNVNIHQFVETVPAKLRELLQQCGNRYIAFNNDATGMEMLNQVEEFFRMVDVMVKNNGGSCYTTEFYQEADKAIKRRMAEQKRAYERKKEQEKEEMKRQIEEKYNADLEKMSIQKSRLENELQLQSQQEEWSKKQNQDLENQLFNLQKRLDSKEQESSRGREDTKRLEMLIEGIQRQMSDMQRLSIDGETKRLQREREEITHIYHRMADTVVSSKRESGNASPELTMQRHMMLEQKFQMQLQMQKDELTRKMESEIAEMKRQKEIEYNDKMKAENLRREERDKIEKENTGPLDDLIAAGKKLFSGIAKGAKAVWNFFTK